MRRALWSLVLFPAFLAVPSDRLRSQVVAGTPSPDSVNVANDVLTVDDVARQPERFRSPVSLRGIVAYVSVKENVVVLISESEFAACGTTCPDVTLPVRWQGDLPSVTDLVRVDGQVEKMRKGFLFVASKVEILPPSKSK